MSSTGHPGSPGAGRIGPSKAPVAPRVRILGETAALPLEQRVRRLLEVRPRGLVNVIGPPGSGKTTALQHLAAVLGTDVPLLLIDDTDARDLPVISDCCLTLATSPSSIDPKQFLTWELVPWSEEDWAAYLLATHSGRCRSVVGRVLADPERRTLLGNPQLWRLILDEMAADNSLTTIQAALSAFIDRELASAEDREAAEEFELEAIAPWAGIRGKALPTSVARIYRILRHEPVRLMMGARHLVRRIESGTARRYLVPAGKWRRLALPLDLVRRTAVLAAASPQALELLEKMTYDKDVRLQPSAISLLHAAGIGWRPMSRQVPNLENAWLAGIQWDDIYLAGGLLNRADFCRASLANADLLSSTCNNTNFRAATLRNASLRSAKLIGTNLAAANLCGTRADAADFTGSDLADANFSGASLRGAHFRNVRIEKTRFCRADLNAADFRDATVESADFTDADLTTAHLPGLDLARCTFGSTRLCEADLSGCNLEGVCAENMNFDSALLDGALLTGSMLRSACFASANLRNCGLAEIDWEDADLRGADLRGSTFHLGTTRSGLVGSTIPCEGSRTGFYTDEYFDTAYRNPDEIRKANLCGADLREAQIDGVDFYLVDLRGARYSEDQAEWFRKCGAILCDR